MNTWRRGTDTVLLIFFVSGFCGLIYESVWAHYVKLMLGHAAYAQTLVLVVFIGGSAYQHQLAQETLHPYSIEVIWTSATNLWGNYANVSVPQPRVDHYRALYESLGIYSPEDYDARIAELYKEAEQAGRFRPDGDKPFAPLYASFFHPW